MKKLIMTTLVVAMAVGFSAAPAKAETVMTAKIPFAFRVGGVELEAGAYQIVAEGVKFVVRQKGGDNLAVVWCTRGDSHSASKLVFSVIGDCHFLARVHYGGDVLQLPLTPEERKLRQGGETPQLAFVPLSRAAEGD